MTRRHFLANNLPGHCHLYWNPLICPIIVAQRPLCLFALALILPSAALAAPSPQDGGYGEGGGAEVFRYSTVDEETGEETGYHFLNGQPGEDVDGGFGFTDEAEGKSYDLTFVADENGY